MRTVIKKELRGFFNAPVAVVFLGGFVGALLYTFFWREKFFARGLADLRPLFEWMPKFMIVLVASLAGKMWADERRTGTLEILLTLPVPRWQLVLGKFVAGCAFIAIALVLTLGLPITISHMGRLDWGPVIGGYLASLLMGAAYLSACMCVSAATDNQATAYGASALVCVAMYLIGEGATGEIGRQLGMGAHFESIARGVLDLRDLGYYLGIVATGLALNILLLQRLAWSRGPAARTRRLASILVVVLVAANAIALEVWLAPVHRARIDLTRDKMYSLSSATGKTLAALDEPLLIRGYFSAKMHPKLAPLVPQIKDLLDEYRAAGRGKLRVELVEPDSDAAKLEAKERFGIDPTPLRFASKDEKSVINAYFNIAVEYGGQHAVLNLEDLVTVRVLDVGDVDITLRNLEYQLTGSIKKVVAEFGSVDALFASATSKVKLTVYLTPKTLPQAWKDAPQKLKKAIDELQKQAGGKLDVETIDPTNAQREQLYRSYGLRPYQNLESQEVELFYFHLLLQVGDRIVRIMPPEKLGDTELKAALVAGLKRAAPGFTRVVGLWQPPGGGMMPPQFPGQQPRELPPPQTFNELEKRLARNYEVRPVSLDAPIPEDIDALVLAGPANLDAKSAEHVDQFVMRGGALVVLAGRYRLAVANGFGVEKVTTGLESEFAKWGIRLGDEIVMDKKSDAFLMPEQRPVREIRQLAYPYFVKMDGDQLDGQITDGLAGSVMHFASPVAADAKLGDEPRRVDALLRSSDGAWLEASPSVTPNFEKYPEVGFQSGSAAPAEKRGSQVLAVAVIGGLPSAVAPATGVGSAAAAGAPHLLAHSPPDARVVVFGSSAFVSDDIFGLAQQLESDLSASNVELVHNAVDWSLADTDLLTIRSRGAGAHALTIDADAHETWQTINIVIAAVMLAGIVGGVWWRRRAVAPVEVA